MNLDLPYHSKFDQFNKIGSITEALGGSDTTQIFVHCLDSLTNFAALNSFLNGLERYPERAFVLARSDDIVCITDELDTAYFRFLAGFGVGPKSSNVICVPQDFGHSGLVESLMNDRRAISEIQALVKSRKKIFLNAFVVSEKEFRLAAILEAELNKTIQVWGGNPRIVDDASCKHRVKQKAMELGIPVAGGHVVELQSREDLASMRAAIQRCIEETGRVIVKGSRGDAGSATFIVEQSPESMERLLTTVADSKDNNIYLIEPMFPLSVSPNILMHIGFDKTIQCVGITDQILNDEMKHKGNVYPSTATLLGPMLNSSQKICEWLLMDGYSGLLGLDFAEVVHPATGERKYFLAEVNPRINAGVYPRSLMEHLNKRQNKNNFPFIHAFVSVEIKTGATSFAQLADLCGDLFFKPETARGMVPYNTGCLRYGKFTAALLGKTGEEVTLMQRLLSERITSSGP